jgi:hypothetical protein
MAINLVAINVTILVGECSRPAETRVLESGTRLGVIALRVKDTDGPATSVPVTVWDPPPWFDELASGDPVVVVGKVRRRFYKAGAVTGSRVDVEAEIIARGGKDRRKLVTATRRIQDAIDALSA